MSYDLGGYIYLIQCGDYHKVGITERLGSRIVNYRVSNPYDVNLILFVDREDYKEVEKQIHKRFKDFIHRGEWFVLSKDQVQEVIRLMNQNG